MFNHLNWNWPLVPAGIAVVTMIQFSFNWSISATSLSGLGPAIGKR